MIEPTLAVQKAIRAHLIPNQILADLVPEQNIRAGTTRPERFPTIVIADGQSQFLGRADGGQFIARVFLDLHIWAIEDGMDAAKTIGGILADALRDAPAADGFAFEEGEWKHTRTVWPRDPDPKMGHGVLSVEAVIRWPI